MSATAPFSIDMLTLDAARVVERICAAMRDQVQTPLIVADKVGRAVGMSAAQVEAVYRDIDAKRRAARYQHAAPLLVEAIGKVEPTQDA